MSKKLFLCLLLTAGKALAQQPPAGHLQLWYQQPAVEWTEALPLGNGRLGAMVFGRVNEELIQLNEATLWSGGPVNPYVNPGASAWLPKVREALFRKDYHRADSLLRKMQGDYSQSYLPLGDLRIRMLQPVDSPARYYRNLDIANACAGTWFRGNGVGYTREMFISAPDQVMVIRLKADRKGALNLQISPSSQLRYHNEVDGPREIVMKGKAPSQVDPSYISYNREPIKYEAPGSCKGMRFEMRMRAVSTDGSIHTDTSGITVQHASELTLLLTAATSFNGFDKCPDSEGASETALAKGYLQQASAKSFEQLKARHRQDYQHFFNRVSFTLASPVGDSAARLPVDERMRRYTAGGKDPQLETLYFQYGRYLLISCSRTPGAPANLQGIWNRELRAPWSSNYTININTQMNYWPGEMCNLSEMQSPLHQLVKNMAVTGRQTARNFYNARGWVAHHNSDIWAISNPVGDTGRGDPVWANWMMGGNWLCQSLWEHYRYTGDKDFLRNTAYPLMKSAADFCLDWLVEDSSGYLVTAPSTSPENVFRTETGRQESVSVASTMDMSVIRELFTNLVAAAEVLGTDRAYRDTLVRARSRLYPLQVGKRGNLQEWYLDWEGVDTLHRHISHLYGLFPGREISPLTTPALANACRRSLEIRGDGGTGWSKAWKINTWARLLDGNHAYKLLRELLTLTGKGSIDMHNGGGTYANLFCAHPPFQIDGNFGGTSGIAQMLLQSQLDYVQLLPALPDSWATGEVKGLVAEGGFTVNIRWENGRIREVTLQSRNGGPCRLRALQPLQGLNGARLAGGSKDEYNGYLYTLETKPGGKYVLAGR